jgi:hypothetical protein
MRRRAKLEFVAAQQASLEYCETESFGGWLLESLE